MIFAVWLVLSGLMYSLQLQTGIFRIHCRRYSLIGIVPELYIVRKERVAKDATRSLVYANIYILRL